MHFVNYPRALQKTKAHHPNSNLNIYTTWECQTSFDLFPGWILKNCLVSQVQAILAFKFDSSEVFDMPQDHSRPPSTYIGTFWTIFNHSFSKIVVRIGSIILPPFRVWFAHSILSSNFSSSLRELLFPSSNSIGPLGFFFWSSSVSSRISVPFKLYYWIDLFESLTLLNRSYCVVFRTNSQIRKSVQILINQSNFVEPIQTP